MSTHTLSALRRILAISGSTRTDSVNGQLIRLLAGLSAGRLAITRYEDLAALPHFNPDTDKAGAPAVVQALRQQIAAADGVLICTPEYVFSLPGSLKNALEWTVSTTVFLDKPAALITAAALGETTHASLQRIMDTLGARWSAGSQLLISGVRSKIKDGHCTDAATLTSLQGLVNAFLQDMDSFSGK